MSAPYAQHLDYGWGDSVAGIIWRWSQKSLAIAFGIRHNFNHHLWRFAKLPERSASVPSTLSDVVAALQ